jgi:replicative DNA helicase
MNIEKLILQNLLHSSEYWRKVIPFIRAEYFVDQSERLVFELIKDYTDKYHNVPTLDALNIEVESNAGADEDLYKNSETLVTELTPPQDQTDVDWLVDRTEEFCQDQAIQNGIRASIKILDGQDKIHDKGHIVKIMSDALAVSFDTSIGHDFIEDWGQRFDFYHRVEARIPFDIEFFNTITRGGIYRKTLTVLLGGTGVGKSLVMCHMASANLAAGLNVLYITNELSEEMVAQRIDANLLDVTIDELETLSRNTYEARIEKLKAKTKGKLIIKEYPTSSAGAANFRHLLNELRIKKNFKPDIIYIDYLNICISSRIKMGGSVNSYTYVKAIAEEIRGLAVEFNVPIITATQMNREGFTNSDPGLEHTSESFGLPATADLMLAMTTNEQLAAQNQLLIKQLKNRYRDENIDRRFLIGIDKPKMRLFDLDPQAQRDIASDPAPRPANFSKVKGFGDMSRFSDIS